MVGVIKHMRLFGAATRITITASIRGVCGMRFTKMHGIGNDYVYVDCVRNRPPTDPAALARAISDRHFGVGSDGLILDLPQRARRRPDADVQRRRLRIGDVRQRAAVRREVRPRPRHRDASHASKIETGRGVLTVDLEVRDGKAMRVRVNMGEPILEAAKIPTTLPGDPPVNAKLAAGGVAFEVTCVSMGNPHAVMYVGDEFFDGRERDLVAECGPKIEHHTAFPRRVNVALREGAFAEAK